MDNLTPEYVKRGQKVTEAFARKAWANFCAETLDREVTDERDFMLFLVGYEAGLADKGEVMAALRKEFEEELSDE